MKLFLTFSVLLLHRKKNYCFQQFIPLCELLIIVNTCITKKLYHYENSCVDIVYHKSKVIQRKILIGSKTSTFYRIIFDESTYILVTHNLVVFASLIEEGLSIVFF